MGAIRQELRSHSPIVLTALDHAAHLTPPFEKIWTRALHSQILAKYFLKYSGKRGLFCVIPNLAKVLRQDSASIKKFTSAISVSYTHLTLPTICSV